MIRVATTVADDEGMRAIGTFIPAVHPDGQENPVIGVVRKGGVYQGRAFVVNQWYLTAYEGLRDPEGRLVGMFYVGVRQKTVEARIRQAILQTKVGKTGYVYVIGARGEFRGRYIISHRGERDGENVWDSRDSDGRWLLIRFMIAAGLIVSLIMGMVAVFYTWSIVRPLRKLQQAVEVINDGNLDHLLEIPAQNEIGALSDAFNLMRERLDKAVRGLRVSEAKYRKIFENAVEGLFQSTLEGRFLSANPAMARILGYDSPQELMSEVNDIGSQVYASGSDRDEVLRQLRENGEAAGKELELLRKNGKKIWVTMSCRLTPGEGDAAPVIEGFIADMSSHKMLEEQLRQSQKMEALGTLTGGIAHDFNNILSAILGYSDIVRRKIDPGDPMSRYVKEVISAGEKATQLTRSLLAFSRKQPINLEPVDLNEIIRRTERFLIRIIGEDIEYRSSLHSEPLIALADRGQIEQVLMNLAANARDAMPGGGVLAVTTESIDGEKEMPAVEPPAERYVLLTVSDTGSGMTESVKGRIFEPFFTTKETGKGTGLGLSIVYGIVRQHHGHISVDSAPGRGCTFKIYLPLTRMPLHKEESSLPTSLQRGSETILLAEDDAAVRSLFKSILQENGYTVIEAVDGVDAVAKFIQHEEQIQFLLFDVIMPRKNGKEAYDEIRQRNREVRILFSSGYTSDIIHRQGILDEGIDLIMKPVAPQALLARIREILDRE